MSSAEIKKWSYALSAAGLLVLGSCSGNSDEKRARNLYSEAETLEAQGRYSEALLLLDSIDKSCPAAVEIRRMGMAMRPKMLEQVTNRQLEITDSLAAVNDYRIDSLSGTVQLVKNDIENYFVPKAEGHVDVSSVSGLHGRMAPDGRFYLIATSPSSINSVSVTANAGGESAHTPSVGFDGERNDRVAGHDVITFIEGECQEIAGFITRNRNQPVTVTFSGKSSITMELPDTQKEGIAALFELSKIVRERKRQEIEKQRLEKTLSVVRSQIARTIMTDSLDME